MRLTEKLDELARYCADLDSIMPSDYRTYADLKTKAACERYFEKIVEAVDAAFLMIKENRRQIPEEDKQAFTTLAAQGIIDEMLASRLREAKGMRNIIAHEYGVVDDEMVYHAITEEVLRDAASFFTALRTKAGSVKAQRRRQ